MIFNDHYANRFFCHRCSFACARFSLFKDSNILCVSPRRSTQPYCRPAARLAGHFQRPANCRCALAHSGQPIVTRRGSRVRCKSLSVIPYFKRNLLRPILQLHIQILRARVLLYIVDGFLRNTKNLALRAWGQRPVRAKDAEACFQLTAAGALHHAAQPHRQRRFARVLRTQRPDRLPCIGQPFSYISARQVQVFCRCVHFAHAQ